MPGENRMLKVVWLCHFANQEMNDTFKTQVNDFAPWISLLINQFEFSEKVHLSIVAPNVFNNTNSSFTLRSVDYHFYKYSPNWLDYRRFEQYRVGYLNDFSGSTKNIIKLIEEINPDLIHLHGAENPYYSYAMFDMFSKYPCLTTIQGFACNSKKRGFIYDYFRNKRCDIESRIIKNSQYIGVRTDEMSEQVKEMNPHAVLCWHNYPINKPEYSKYESTEKIYDVAFYARVCSDKGIEDLIKALHIVKQDISDIKLIVIGGGAPKYLKYLHQNILKCGLEENVTFVGFQKQNDAFLLLSKSKLYVIPTHHDIIPGTLIESMFLKLPAIAYDVGGIASLNNNAESVMLVQKGDIKYLASSVLNLLFDTERAKSLSENAFLEVGNRFQNERIYSDLIAVYSRIVAG